MLDDELPIDFIDVGILIRVNDEHPLNIDISIDETDDGIIICESDLHP